jgi:hypothetical protein
MKYKIGDRVRVVRNNPENVLGKLGIGSEFTISKIEKSCLNYIGWWIHPLDGDPSAIDEVELINCCDETISSAKNIMTNIIDFAKELTLSENERLLRKQGLKNSCGDYTEESRELVINRLCSEQEEYLIKVAKAKEESEKK